jgi:acyl CoA:acetate/3-ketoacid CoA transferase alpha subunit
VSDQAHQFLTNWFDHHIRPLPAVQRLAEAARLAVQCRLDATAAGIPLQAIRDAVGGDLIRAILQALDREARLVDGTSALSESAPLADA